MKRILYQFTLITVLVLALPSAASAQSIEDTALRFDGNDRALVSDAAMPTLSSSFTIEAWVFLNNLSQHHTVVDLSNDFDLLILSGGRMEINASSGSALTGSVVPAGSWQHVAVVANAATSSYKLYLNGSQVGSAAYSPRQHSGRLNIGARDANRGTQVYTNGRIDEVRIWNVARTQLQIADNRLTELATLPRPAEIVAYYPIRMSGTTLDDWNGTADGSIGTAVRITPGAPFPAPDTDDDGVPDDLDAFPNDPSETADSDGDGVGDNTDAFPNDASETTDSDGDGLGDAADLDSDGDGKVDGITEASQMLTAALSGISDKHHAKSVEDAIKGLDKAMDPALWSGPSALILNPRHGHKAFDGTKKAVKSLESVASSAPVPATVSVSVTEVMKETSTRSINAAQATCDGASSPKEQEKCQKEVDQATDIMAKAAIEADKGKLDKAIDRYKQAWQHSETAQQKAIAKIAVDEAVSPIARTLIASASEVPVALSLEGSYPNPFNPATTIRFGLPETMDVHLEVFDLLGRQVRVLIDGSLNAGYHNVQFNAGHLSSGTYVYRLRTKSGVLVGVTHLLK